MKKIVVASKNPVKIAAAIEGFQKMFPHETFEAVGVSVSSGVSEQPISSHETLRGATQRTENAAVEVTEADYWVGIEGGTEENGHEMEAFAWIVIKDSVRCGKSRTGTFFLPSKVAELIRQGIELGEADDIVFGRTNSKQKNGAVGLLTDDVIDRTAYYTQAVILALIPFKNPQLY